MTLLHIGWLSSMDPSRQPPWIIPYNSLTSLCWSMRLQPWIPRPFQPTQSMKNSTLSTPRPFFSTVIKPQFLDNNVTKDINRTV